MKIKNKEDFIRYQIKAACSRGEDGVISCETPKDKPRLRLSDFYHTETPIEYTGSVSSLMADLQPTEQTRRDKMRKTV